MKKSRLLQKTLFAGITGMLLFPATVSAASSYYKVDKYGELYDYKGSQNVTIRENTSAISCDAFDDEEITSFSVASGNSYFKSVNGVLYTKDGKTLVRFPTEKKGSFTIPSTVTKIAMNAFLDCDLEHVTIPSSVTSIEDNAFAGCYRLTSASIKAKIKTIPSYCFSDCLSLKSVSIPSSVTKIADNAFYNCEKLKSISLPANLETLRYKSFSGCESLTTVTIPKKVTSIESDTFSYCTNLKTVTLHNKVTYINYDAFANCKNLVNVKNTQGITYIYSGAFENCEKLNGFSFGNKLEVISSDAFRNCKSLGNIFIPASVRTVGDSAFCGAATNISVAAQNKFYSSEKGLLLNKNKDTLIQIPYGKKDNLVMPKTITNVSYNAIHSTLITTLTYSDNVSEVKNANIYDCPNLTTITLPANLKKIHAKYYSPSQSMCPKLSKILISKENPRFTSYDGVLYNKTQTELRFYPYGKKGTLKIPAACSNVTNQISVNKLSEIKVPKNNYTYSSIDGALLNDKETSILGFPCKKETYRISRYIDNISYLTKNKDILSLKSVTCAKKNKYFYTKDGVIFKQNKKKKNAKSTLIFYPAYKKGAYTVPKSTTYIDDVAFYNCQYLTKLTITKNIKRYSSNSIEFYGCYALKEIKIDEGSLNSIRLRFDDEDNLQLSKITFPSNIMSIKMSGLPEKVNIYGWDNTGAQTIAKKYKCNYIRRGTVPEKVTGMKLKKIIDKYELTWNPSQGVSGYQIYTQYETLAEISGANKTSYKIKSLYDIEASRVYVRPYQVQNGKKVYGKGNSLYIN